MDWTIKPQTNSSAEAASTVPEEVISLNSLVWKLFLRLHLRQSQRYSHF
jgi:hypothetical protein